MKQITPAIVAAGICLMPHARAEPVDYRTQVLPLLSENCFNCHGPDSGTRKGGLRLDRREDALRAAESGEFAIVPGNPEASSLLARMTSHDPDEIMPPPASKKTIPTAAIATLRKWIEQGAEYRNHWAFDAVVRPAVPEPSPSSWLKNPSMLSSSIRSPSTSSSHLRKRPNPPCCAA
jgi:mono/diheme cytochrome c family protein